MGRKQGGQPGNKNARTHGLHAVRAALVELGAQPPLDGRSAVAQELHRYQLELVGDLGGDPSTAQRTLVDIVARQKLILDSIDSFLLTRPFIHGVELAPVVKQRQVIADALARMLGQLGLQRRVHRGPELAEYIEASKAGRTS